MITKKEILLAINEDNFKLDELVAILEVVAHKSSVLTISEMARKEGKSANGVRESKKYRKLMIGGQKMCVKGLNDSNLPF